MKEKGPLVSIICLTYNHEAYIKDALEGFVMQKTNFAFEIIVHDDASTDNTASIVKSYELKYPKLFANIYQTENQYSKGNGDVGRIVFGAARGKYIAMCEGDDYWIDPLKLKKQTDFLETNEEYGLVHTDYDRYYTVSGVWWRNRLHSTYKDNLKVLSGELSEALLTHKTMIWTGTVCFRKEFVMMKGYSEIVSQNFYAGDLPLWNWIALHSKIKYIDDSTAVRNVLARSATQGVNHKTRLWMYKSDLLTVKYFVDTFNLSPEILKSEEFFYYTRCLNQSFDTNQGNDFIEISNKLKCEGNKISWRWKLKLIGIKYKNAYLPVKLFFALQDKFIRKLIDMKIMKESIFR